MIDEVLKKEERRSSMKGKENKQPRCCECCPCEYQQEINRIRIVAKCGELLIKDLDVIATFLDGLYYTPYRVPGHVSSAMIDAVVIAQRLEKGGKL